MKSFITKITIPKMVEGSCIFPAFPCEANTHNNVINVICGPNYSGKSYLLRAICALINNRAAARKYPGFAIELSEDVPPRMYTTGKLWREKDSVGLVALRSKILGQPDYDYRFFLAKLFMDQLESQTELLKALKIESIGKTETVRDALVQSSKIIKAIPIDEEKLYPCDDRNNLVKLIEEFLQLHLYFRRVKDGIEFMQVNPSGAIIPFHEWSDGQKSIFYLLLVVEYYKPNILIVDEIENHLHPKLITALMLHLKKRVNQSFIASHSPHVMSSRYCDRMFYMEIQKNPIPKKIIDRYTKVQSQKHPTRSITTLDNASDLILGIYKLFDNSDNELLRQASRLTHVAEINFYAALCKSFELEVIDASEKVIPDMQTAEFLKAIKAKDGEEIVVLDYGAGIGRVAKEVSKTEIMIKKKCTWLCWDPIAKQREKLRQNVSILPMACSVPDSIDDIRDGSCDIVLVANVLHELNPFQISEVLLNASKKLKKDIGTLFVLEIYPLLHPEKLAVPYSDTNMRRLLNSVGFISTTRTFAIKGCTAYTASACINSDLGNNSNIVAEKVEQLWNEIKIDALSSYFQRPNTLDNIDYSVFAQELFTIASIESWGNGLWK